MICGAGGRDFHTFNVLWREDPAVDVVAFTAAQIPGIDERTYPPSLAGPRYPEGIPIRPEAELEEIVRRERVDDVVFAYSDLAYDAVMRLGAVANGAGAGFSLPSPRASMLRAAVPVVAVCAVRTGAGKSQTSRAVARIAQGAGLRVGLIRHPMPYGDLEAQRVQRFATLADIDAADPTIEEREEYERPVEEGVLVWAGVDYAEITRAAEAEADLLIWDGGNNDLPFLAPDLHLVVADPLRPGDELAYYPGEANLRMADAVVVNKLDSAEPAAVERVLADIAAANPDAAIVRANSPVTLDPGPDLAGARVLVVEDGPTVTHGEMGFGAGTVAARAAGAAEIVDPRPSAVGSIADTFRRYPHLDHALPAMGYSHEQLRDLEATIEAAECDVVVSGTPMDLTRLVTTRHPVRGTRYELDVVGEPRLEDLLEPVLARASQG